MAMKQRNLFWIALAFILAACGGKQAEQKEQLHVAEVTEPLYPIVIPFEDSIRVERDIKLSDLADSVVYIPLETDDDCLIDIIMSGNIIKTGTHWFLSSNTRQFQYTLDGRYVRSFGSRGGGPGEFNYIQQTDVNEQSGLLFLLTTSGKINVYDIKTGKFLRAMKIPSVDTQQFAMLDDSTAVTFLPNNNGQQRERLFISGLRGDTLHTFFRSDLFEVRSGKRWVMGSSTDRYLFHYADKVCYKEYYNDTLFVVTPQSLEPRYIVDLGKYSIPVHCRMEACDGDWKTYNSLAASYIRTQLIETDSLLFMPYNYWAGNRNRYMQLYRKSTGECFSVPGGYILNDFPGALPLRPVTAVSGNILVSVWEVGDIFKEAEKNPAVLQHPVLGKLDEDDNPVLMVVYLKSK